MAEVAKNMHYVYFLKSNKNEKIYVGFTSKSPKVRLREHNSGSSKWSKNNGSFRLIYFEEYFCKKDARKRELFYKTGFGKKIKQSIVSVLN